MKHKAFTLSEALIVLSMVSVLAALSITAVSKAKPDESVIMFRRGYSMITRIVNELINDRELYPHAQDPFNSTNQVLGNTGYYKGLADYTLTDEMKTSYPCLTEGSDLEKMKFPNLFAFKANPVTVDLYTSGRSIGKKFTTPDGMYWIVSSSSKMTTNGTIAIISLFTQGENNGCAYSASCLIPSRFVFKVFNNGEIKPYIDKTGEPNDPMACSYLRYPKINRAKEIPTDANVNSCFAD
ncbi:hypothetical protein IKE67_01060 [bacterium]|nr:hypothetical protein [bacterium]